MTPSAREPADDAPDRPGSRRAGRIGTAVERRLGVDTRALAAFRVSIGLLVLVDLAMRGSQLRTFYTDAGVLPRSVLAETAPALAAGSLHTVTGSVLGQAVLFVAAGAAALAVTLGYRTRPATAVVLVAHASLYTRNPYLLNGGDVLLVLALLLGLFLPLGERWSVDAARRAGTPSRERVANLATATILLQLVVVYTANLAFKARSEAWTDGVAVRYVMELEQFAVGIGPTLAEVPGLLVALNWAWMGMLAAAVLLVVTTGWRRSALVAGFVGAHFGMLATMRLGLFPLVVVALLLLYLPTSAWRRLETALADAGVDRPTATGATSIDTGRFGTGPRLPESWRRTGRTLGTVVLAVLLVVSVAWPATALVAGDRGVDVPGETDGYAWTLFAPNTPTDVEWWVAPVTLANGDRVDGLTGEAVDWDDPADAADRYPSTLWHRYLDEAQDGTELERRHLAEYLCTEVARSEGVDAESVSLHVLQRPVEAVGGGERSQTELLTHEC